MIDPNDYIPDWTERYPEPPVSEEENYDDADDWGDEKRLDKYDD